MTMKTNLKPFVNFIARCVEESLALYLAAVKPSSGRNRFMKLAEAAKIVPYSKGYLGLLARRGRMAATKIGKDWHVTPEALKAYLASVTPKNTRKTRKGGN